MKATIEVSGVYLFFEANPGILYGREAESGYRQIACHLALDAFAGEVRDHLQQHRNSPKPRYPVLSVAVHPEIAVRYQYTAVGKILSACHHANSVVGSL